KVGRNVLIMPDGTERELGGKASVSVEAGTVVRVETPGGGGYGSLRSR
ncbi:MAG: hydantoinase B/oxoprolinase family protein, partial [Gemmatimonadetes bacterium]|nr:hydantoinase B/oxoprolinase family protein [Gemmatimonadota bacterium]